MTPEQVKQAVALVERIADFHLDGEEVYGVTYEQSIDDAFETCSRVIREARKIAWPLE